MTTAMRRTEYVRLSQIVPAARNAKAHDTAGIWASISRFGVVDAPVIDERTGRLVAGHGRVADLQARAAARQDPPDGITLADDGEWMVPVQRGWSSRSDIEADAVGVALNRLTEKGGWEDRDLAEMLEEFADTDEDLLAATGFARDDLPGLLAGFGEDDEEPSGGGGSPADMPQRCPECGNPLR